MWGWSLATLAPRSWVTSASVLARQRARNHRAAPAPTIAAPAPSPSLTSAGSAETRRPGNAPDAGGCRRPLALPVPQQAAHHDQLTQVIGRVVDHQQDLAEVSLAGAVR